jgi:hypothetical protein
LTLIIIQFLRGIVEGYCFPYLHRHCQNVGGTPVHFTDIAFSEADTDKIDVYYMQGSNGEQDLDFKKLRLLRVFPHQ